MHVITPGDKAFDEYDPIDKQGGAILCIVANDKRAPIAVISECKHAWNEMPVALYTAEMLRPRVKYRPFNDAEINLMFSAAEEVVAILREYLELHHSDIISELGAEVDATETPDICPTWGAGCGGCYNCR